VEIEFDNLTKILAEDFMNDNIIDNPMYWIGFANDMISFLESWESVGESIGAWDAVNPVVIDSLTAAITLDPGISFSAH